METSVKELEKIRKEGLKALKEKLGVEGTMKFIQMCSEEKGDYTVERRNKLKHLQKEELENFLREEIE